MPTWKKLSSSLFRQNRAVFVIEYYCDANRCHKNRIYVLFDRDGVDGQIKELHGDGQETFCHVSTLAFMKWTPFLDETSKRQILFGCFKNSHSFSFHDRFYTNYFSFWSWIWKKKYTSTNFSGLSNNDRSTYSQLSQISTDEMRSKILRIKTTKSLIKLITFNWSLNDSERDLCCYFCVGRMMNAW